jgi:hypothetical protein
VSGGAEHAAPLRLGELEAFSWRRRADEELLRREGRRWTLWTSGVVVTFLVPGVLLLALSPWTFPVALASFGHAWVINELYARRGARSVVPGLGTPTSEAERAAMGLLGDLMGHRDRDLVGRTGLAPQEGRLGIWLVGEQGAFLVRPGGRRVDCWCVRVGDAKGLPPGDRVAHLLLALREDETGFATIANLAFSGAPWRVRRRMPAEARPALDEAVARARGRGGRSRGPDG